VLRRFEIYTVRNDVAPETVRQLEAAFRGCGDFIPELTHSVVGTNLSDLDVQMVWEHSYDSPEAYQRYMVHPYHANILDRYLLNDLAERIVTDSPLGDGTLVGYTCNGPDFFMRDGMRKVVLFGLEGDPAQQDAFLAALRGLAGSTEGVILSVVEPNTFGVAWFDGVTPILPPSQWTHVWELGFDSAASYDAYQRSDAPLARAEAAGWSGDVGVVRQAAELHYVVNG
jgi:Stress responsive A/B Barrel Domain